MAKRSYLTLCQKLRLEIGESGSGPSAVTSQTGIYQNIVDWIASADYAIQSLYHDWNFLWDDTFSDSTIAGTATVAAPSTLGVWDTDSFFLDYSTASYTKLEQMDYMDYHNNYAPGSQTNRKPTHFAIKPNGDVALYPTPDAAYTLSAHYFMKPVRMTANADTSQIPEEYERAILARAKMYYAEEQEFPQLYQIAAQEYQEQLARLESNELPGQENRYRGAAGEQYVIRPE